LAFSVHICQKSENFAIFLIEKLKIALFFLLIFEKIFDKNDYNIF
jgi:hypothetical protein